MYLLLMPVIGPNMRRAGPHAHSYGHKCQKGPDEIQSHEAKTHSTIVLKRLNLVSVQRFMPIELAISEFFVLHANAHTRVHVRARARAHTHTHTHTHTPHHTTPHHTEHLFIEKYRTSIQMKKHYSAKPLAASYYRSKCTVQECKYVVRYKVTWTSLDTTCQDMSN